MCPVGPDSIFVAFCPHVAQRRTDDPPTRPPCPSLCQLCISRVRSNLARGAVVMPPLSGRRFARPVFPSSSPHTNPSRPAGCLMPRYRHTPSVYGTAGNVGRKAQESRDKSPIEGESPQTETARNIPVSIAIAQWPPAPQLRWCPPMVAVARMGTRQRLRLLLLPVVIGLAKRKKRLLWSPPSLPQPKRCHL